MQNSIIGHHNIIKQLHNAVISERVAGAYLFTGEKGVGKETVANYFANLILCEGIDTEQTPCGTCRACRKIKNGNHPDLHFIRPDGAQIKIDQIREMQQRIYFQPLEGIRKIYILANTERLHEAAANAILKTLEEPPAATTLILLTENIETMIPTIRSRCQILPFYPLHAEQLTIELVEKFSIDEDTASAVAILSNGLVGKAITLIENDMTGSQIVPEILSETDHMAAFRIAEEIEKNQDSLDELLSWYRDLLLLHQGVSIELLTHPDAVAELNVLVSKYSRLRIQRAIKNVLETKRLIQNTYVTKITALEVMCLKLIKPDF